MGGQEQTLRKKRHLQNVDNVIFTGNYVIIRGKVFIFPCSCEQRRSCILNRK